MKLFVNILLGLLSAVSLAVLLLQGFGLPALLPWADLLLRIAAAFFIQWLFSRVFQKKWLRSLPIILTSLAGIWGFFLFLTSPSWRNATFGNFMADYASLALSCAAFWFLHWLLPRLVPRIKRAVKNFFRKKKKAKADKKDMPRFR